MWPLTRSWMSFGVVLLLLLSGAPALAREFRSMDDVASITTYRIETEFRIGGDQPLQLVEATGAYGKTPARYDLDITVTEMNSDPVTFSGRQVEGQFYVRVSDQWIETEKFHYEEFISLKPDHLLGIADRLQEDGATELNGRSVQILRGDKADLLAADVDPKAIDFSRLESAALTLWVDRQERFIVKLHITGEARSRGESLPVEVRYEYLDIGRPVVIERPEVEPVVTNEPPPLTRADVTRKLGFDFPVPDGAHISIHGATVSLLTDIPLTEARQYAERSMRSVGFEPGETIERHPGEFYADYASGERSIGVLVFQVSERGATIQVGALK